MSFEEAAKTVFGDTAPAEASPTPEAPAEAPAEAALAPEEPAPDPKQERVAARIAAATRAEIRAAQARAELKAQQAELERRAAELEATAAKYKLLEEDPVKAFETLKLDPKTFLEKLSGEYKPENVAERELAKLKAEFEALKAETTRERETAKEREQRIATEMAWKEASQGFIAHVEATAEKYPNLVAEFTEGEAVAAAEQVLLEVVGHDDAGKPVTRTQAYFDKFGTYPDNDVIAEYLDAQAKARAEARQNSAWRKRGESATQGSQPLSNGDPIPKAPPVNKGSSPRTLTSRAASEKATSLSKQWSQEAADEESLRILEAALRKMG